MLRSGRGASVPTNSYMDSADGSRAVSETMLLPRGVEFGTYTIRPPLIKPSKIHEMGGWVINFAIGCTFGCRFCYVDQIQKKFGVRRAGSVVLNDWGNYFLLPTNLKEAIDQTDWGKWSGKEVMLSSTHDAYLPWLARWTRRILERALPAGVGINILTRSPLVEKDFDLLSQYPDQVSVSVSAATMNRELIRLTEPRAVLTTRRLEILKSAKSHGLSTGIHVGPIFPPNRVRSDLKADLYELASEIAKVDPDSISGEALHARGPNMRSLEEVLGAEMSLKGFEEEAQRIFLASLAAHQLVGCWSS